LALLSAVSSTGRSSLLLLLVLLLLLLLLLHVMLLLLSLLLLLRSSLVAGMMLYGTRAAWPCLGGGAVCLLPLSWKSLHTTPDMPPPGTWA
jgi:hypothetical protein